MEKRKLSIFEIVSIILIVVLVVAVVVQICVMINLKKQIDDKNKELKELPSSSMVEYVDDFWN